MMWSGATFSPTSATCLEEFPAHPLLATSAFGASRPRLMTLLEAQLPHAREEPRGSLEHGAGEIERDASVRWLARAGGHH